jgi:hypothetical protein
MPTNFTIPTPCHEDWKQMTPQAQGRFCAACQKCVFDLRSKTQDEIHDLYVAQGGDLCGRVSASQLSPAPRIQCVSLRSVLAQVNQNGWTQLRRFAFALLLAFGLSQTGWAQTNPADTLLPKIENYAIAGGITFEPSSKNTKEPRAKRIVVEGEVMDADYQRLADVEVVLTTSEGDQVMTRTNTDGSYRLVVRSTEAYAVHARRGAEITDWDDDEQALFDDQTGQPIRWHQLQFAENEKVRPRGHPSASDTVADADIQPLDDADDQDEVDVLQRQPIKTDEKVPVTTGDLPMQLHPNPSRSTVYLRVDVLAVTRLHVRILGLDGQVVHSQDWEAQPGIDLTLHIQHLSVGTYVIEIRDQDGHRSSRPIVVQ